MLMLIYAAEALPIVGADAWKRVGLAKSLVRLQIQEALLVPALAGA